MHLFNNSCPPTVCNAMRRPIREEELTWGARSSYLGMFSPYLLKTKKGTTKTFFCRGKTKFGCTELHRFSDALGAHSSLPASCRELRQYRGQTTLHRHVTQRYSRKSRMIRYSEFLEEISNALRSKTESQLVL